MSAAPSTSKIELWASWEGHVVNGMYPLRRCLGSSDHSGVFLTDWRNATPSEVAIKIVPAVPGHAESQLSRWLSVANLDHPNLVRIFEAGQCQVDGRPYLYALMEYADQDLAQLLQRRALTEDEAREMLMPALGTLAFLHARKLVQGRMKPSNILVVGDRLKLASDTVCREGEAFEGGNTLSVYDSPEVRETGRSAAGDIWALGVTLCEALTRRQPLALHGGGNPVFPVDLSLAFRELASWCLSRRPSDRPEVAELEASLRGERTVPVAIPAVEPSASSVPSAELAPIEPSTELQTTGSPTLHSIATEPAARAMAPTATDGEAASVVAQAASTVASAVTPQRLPHSAPAAAVPLATPTGASAASAVPPSVPSGTTARPTVPPSAPSGTTARPAVPAPAPTATASASVASSPAAAATRTASATSQAAPSAGVLARPVPPPAPQSEDYTSGPVSESRQPPSDEEESKSRYALWAATLVAALVIAWVSMKLLSEPSSEPASDTVADVAPDNDSGTLASDAGDTGSVAATGASGAATGADRALANADRAARQVAPGQAAVEADMPPGNPPAVRSASTRPASTRSATPESSAPPSADLPPSEVNEVIPDVPSNASRTIRGRVRVSVRVIVEKDGTVFAALADDRGPSRYFERLAIDAAKKWTFAPSDTDEQRLMLIRFTFTRQGTTASATALR